MAVDVTGAEGLLELGEIVTVSEVTTGGHVKTSSKPLPHAKLPRRNIHGVMNIFSGHHGRYNYIGRLDDNGWGALHFFTTNRYLRVRITCGLKRHHMERLGTLYCKTLHKKRCWYKRFWD